MTARASEPSTEAPPRAASTPINESLEIRSVDGVRTIVCVHCDHVVCDAEAELNDHLARYVGPPSDGGPLNWPSPRDFVDAEVVFEQWYCPGCFTALATSILPADHPILSDHVSAGPGDRSDEERA